MDIAEFWDAARVSDDLNPAKAVMGITVAGSIPPPSWSFGDTPEMADRLAQLVEDGTKTATAGALRDYEDEDEPLPTVGDLAIVLDGQDRPRALIRCTDVRIVPFDEVDAAHAHAEGEGDRSLESWREGHRAFFERNGGFEPSMPLVCEYFEVIYP